MFRFIQMRYSYFGVSGWRSDASREKAALLDEDRLMQRFRFFQALPLASLAAQDDPDFFLGILVSEDMPQRSLSLLREASHDVLGDRVGIFPRAPGQAGDVFLDIQKEVARGHEQTLQIVLDDDDALARDFVSVAAKEAELAMVRPAVNRDYCFLSFSRGVSLILNDDGSRDIFIREAPYNNQGLSLIGPTDTGKSLYRVAHKKLARSHPARVINDMQFYHIRTLHNLNDSLAKFDRSMPLKPFHRRALDARFPLLAGLDAALGRADSTA